jgi:hypothetical protein
MTKTKAGPVTRRVRHGAVRHAVVTVDRRRGIIVAEAEADILAAGPGVNAIKLFSFVTDDEPQ